MWYEIEHPQDGYELSKTFIFSGFIEAVTFCLKVAFIAERLNHHPSITIEYNKVRISTSTHDEGNQITDKDRELTAEIDKIEP